MTYAVVPPRSIPTLDSVVYNDSIFNRNSQENYVFTRFLLFLISRANQRKTTSSIARIVLLQYNGHIDTSILQNIYRPSGKWVTPDMCTFTIGDKTISVFSTVPNAATPVIYLNTFSGEGQKVFEATQATGCPPFTLVSISNLEWNHDMVPWNSPPIFKNADACTGGADDYLRFLTEEIIPTAESELPAPPRWRGIAGYSLAGLFALYAIYQTALFSRVGSMSGSLWFPGMKEYIFSNEPKRCPECAYFSLGDKESKTRNPVLRTVQENTEAIQAYYQSKGVDTSFQLNRGNHFVQSVERTAAGIAWMVSR